MDFAALVVAPPIPGSKGRVTHAPAQERFLPSRHPGSRALPRARSENRVSGAWAPFTFRRRAYTSSSRGRASFRRPISTRIAPS